MQNNKKKKRQGIKKIANGEREILKSVIILNVNELCTPNKSIYVKLKKKKAKCLFLQKETLETQKTEICYPQQKKRQQEEQKVAVLGRKQKRALTFS